MTASISTFTFRLLYFVLVKSRNQTIGTCFNFSKNYCDDNNLGTLLCLELIEIAEKQYTIFRKFWPKHSIIGFNRRGVGRAFQRHFILKSISLKVIGPKPIFITLNNIIGPKVTNNNNRKEKKKDSASKVANDQQKEDDGGESVEVKQSLKSILTSFEKF